MPGRPRRPVLSQARGRRGNSSRRRADALCPVAAGCEASGPVCPAGCSDPTTAGAMSPPIATITGGEVALSASHEDAVAGGRSLRCLIVVLGYNDTRAGGDREVRCSSISSIRAASPTAGCISVALKDMGKCWRFAGRRRQSRCGDGSRDLVGPRAPKTAEPTRTWVAPSWMAVSKSALIAHAELLKAIAAGDVRKEGEMAAGSSSAGGCT